MNAGLHQIAKHRLVDTATLLSGAPRMHERSIGDLVDHTVASSAHASVCQNGRRGRMGAAGGKR